MTDPTREAQVAGGIVLVLGSAPDALECRDWPRGDISAIVALNNAWRVRPDWDYLVVPEDFPPDRMPPAIARHQTVIRADRFVPANNAFGGILYAGGTMAFTAGYWALAALRPRVLAFFGCDMVYASNGRTHFYGRGSADPLRPDVSLRNLEAKAARLRLIAATRGCACVRLSRGESRLGYPVVEPTGLTDVAPPAMLRPGRLQADALRREAALGYHVPSGRYWTEADRFDPTEIDALDDLWLHAAQEADNPV